jgi:hypothetical protein
MAIGFADKSLEGGDATAEFIAGLGVAAAWPPAVRAQQPRGVRRVGVLGRLPRLGGPVDGLGQPYPNQAVTRIFLDDRVVIVHVTQRAFACRQNCD